MERKGGSTARLLGASSHTFNWFVKWKISQLKGPRKTGVRASEAVVDRRGCDAGQGFPGRVWRSCQPVKQWEGSLPARKGVKGINLLTDHILGG